MKQLIGYFRVLVFELQYKYLFSGSIILLKQGAKCLIEKDVKIAKSKIVVTSGSILAIKSGSSISNANIFVDGTMHLEDNCILDKGDSPCKVQILINGKGQFKLNSHSRIRCKVWIRFGGKVKIGEYTNINEGSEIRSDEQVTIGDYCMISYNCVIWDTNTHSMYSDEERRKLTKDYFPRFGYEYEKPKTAPVSIGNDCWIGREAAILKGVTIKNSVTIGYRTAISKGIIEDHNTVIQQLAYRVISNSN